MTIYQQKLETLVKKLQALEFDLEVEIKHRDNYEDRVDAREACEAVWKELVKEVGEERAHFLMK